MPQTIAHRPLPSGRGRSQYVYRKNPKQTAQGQTHVTGIRSAVVSIVAAVKRSIRRPDQFELIKKKKRKMEKWLNHSMPQKEEDETEEQRTWNPRKNKQILDYKIKQHEAKIC